MITSRLETTYAISLGIDSEAENGYSYHVCQVQGVLNWQDASSTIDALDTLDK
ncbi:MAG: hypothetical protein F6J96_23600 [Symploca sp. SIO1C2]|nr:hypothetical protein [Symploca sp. SIO1C2]